MLFAINVNAMTLKPIGATSAKPGDEIIMYIALERDVDEEEISAISGVLSWDDDVLSLSNEKLLISNWTSLGSVSNNGKFGYGNLSFDNLINSTSTNIVELTYLVKDNAPSGNTNISITNSKVTDSVGNGITSNNGIHTINISKILSSVNTLKSLSLSSGTIDFKSNTKTYNVSVLNDISSIKISSELTDANSSYVTGYGNRTVTLNVGSNEVLVKIKAENGDINTYTLNITRETAVSNTIVKDIDIDGYTLEFNSNLFEYNLKIEEENSLNFDISLMNSAFTYEIIGNENLTNGSVIIIRATDGNDVHEYKINIIKDNLDDDKDEVIDVPKTSLNITTIIIVAGILVGSFGIYIVVKSNIFKSK